MMPIEIAQLLTDFLMQQSKTVRLVEVTRRNMVKFSISQQVFDATTNYMAALGNSTDEAEIAAYHDDVKFLQDEVGRGFPFLHGVATVSLWANLETFVRDLVALLLEFNPTFWERPEIANLKVSISEFEQKGIEGRCRYVVNTLEYNLRSKEIRGAEKFEALLRSFGLTGPIDDSVKEALFELSQVRNAIVHSNGRADEKLSKNCPRLKLAPGDEIVVPISDVHKYTHKTQIYGILILQRVTVYFKDDQSPINALLSAYLLE